MKTLTFDAETNGVWGKGFAIGATVYYRDKLQDTFFAYLGPEHATIPHVREIILPALANEEPTHDSHEGMLRAFGAFYRKHKFGSDVVAYMGFPIETKLLQELADLGELDDTTLPYSLIPRPLIDLGAVLVAKGKKRSMDAYHHRYRLLEGRPEVAGMIKHHPVYDSAAAALSYAHLMGWYKTSKTPSS